MIFRSYHISRMNPYQEINNGLAINERSPNYGRYRLCFNQVYPFREPLYDRLVIKLKNTEEAKIVFDFLPEHIGIIHYFKQKDIRENKYWQLDFFEDDEEFLVFEMLSDVKYIALENIYFSIMELAHYLEDCHFFIYSTGDNDDRWIDEYQIENGQVAMERSYTKTEIYLGRLDFYLTRAEKNIKDDRFMKFALFQLYDRLHFWIKDLMKYPTKDILKKSSLNSTYKHYFDKLYSIDKECKDLNSLNRKYNFNSMI